MGMEEQRSKRNFAYQFYLFTCLNKLFWDHRLYYHSYYFISLLEETNAVLLALLINGMLIGLTAYSMYTAFGVEFFELRDPFKEHEN